MLASYSILAVLATFGIASAQDQDPCRFPYWECEGGKAKWKPIGELIGVFPTPINVTFRDNIEEVHIKTEKAMADLLGVGGPSLKKLEIQVAKSISLHNICDLIGQSKGNTFEVDIDETIGRLSQNQHCTGGQNGKRKIELQISNSKLLVDTQVGSYDSEADLKFAARVFNPITLDNVTVYNTRRIAFTHYQNGGVRIVEPIQLPSVQICNVNQRTVPDQLKLCNNTHIASSDVAVYPENKDRFQMTDAPPNNSASSGKLSMDLAGVLIMGIIPAATLLVHLALRQHH